MQAKGDREGGWEVSQWGLVPHAPDKHIAHRPSLCSAQSHTKNARHASRSKKWWQKRTASLTFVLHARRIKIYKEREKEKLIDYQSSLSNKILGKKTQLKNIDLSAGKTGVPVPLDATRKKQQRLTWGGSRTSYGRSCTVQSTRPTLPHKTKCKISLGSNTENIRTHRPRADLVSV